MPLCKQSLLISIYIYIIDNPSIVINGHDGEPFFDNTSIVQGCGETFLETDTDFELELTKVDLGAGVISGTFSGVFTRVEPNHNCTDSIVITDGIFDLPITF